jgi:hypothetical protein
MRALALMVALFGLGCSSSASRPDATAPRDVGEPPDAIAPKDVGEPPDAEGPDLPASADVAQARDVVRLGACELVVAFLHVRTADGRATIARAEVTGCQPQGGSCWPGDGDAGPRAPCATLDLLGSAPCAITLTSTTGQTFQQEAQTVIEKTGSYCEVDGEPGRVVEIESLRYQPPEIVVSFGRDGGADATP